MPKQNKLVVLILILLGLFFNLKSQISVSPSVGCSPALLGVNFQYNGSATNLTNIVWNFGDGSPTSNSLTPIHNYIGTGTFVVTFNATGLPTYTALVIVHPSPVASFNYIVPSNHCAPVAVVFNGSSSVPNSIFNWVYGDGGLGSGANNTYSYTIPGSFSAILTVSDVLTGCTGTVSHGPINVSAQPNVLINTFPGTYTCSAPFTVAFTASNSTSGSPLGGGLTYNWNFGNTQTSGAITPGPITYNSQGVYTVSLIATDNNSCSKTSSLLVSVLTPTINAIVPPTVCINTQVNPLQPFPPWFAATVQSNVSSTTWQMGDGNVKIFPSPAMSPTYALNPNIQFVDTIHYYTTPGLKTLTITASVGACVATVTKTIFVEMITPNFTVVPSSFVCNPSLIVTYSNQTTINSGNPISFFWAASHWNNAPVNNYTSTATNPTFTFVQGSLSQYVLYNAYSPTVALFVTSSPLGCQAKIIHEIDKIQRPTAWFKVDKSEGCAPLTVTFRDSSITYSPLFPIVSYTWNNGATGANSLVVSGTGSVIPNFVFTYTATGTYSPFLSIQTASGCASTSYIGTITVVNPVPISYTLPPSTVCAGTPVTLTMSAVPGGTVQHWHAQSDNGYFSGCVNDSTPTWFFTHLGVHSFTLSAYKNSCLSSVVVPNAITVRGPIGKVRYETNCVNPKQVKFYYHLQDATSATLSYGDNTPTLSIAGAANTSVGGFANHTYTATGDFTATLRSFNPGNGCPVFTHTVLVTVRQLSVDFALDTIMCKGVYSQVTVTTSQDVLFGCGRGYSWNYDNTGTEVTTGSLFVSGTTFSAVGAHSLTLKVKDINGCTLALTKPFRVSAPVPTFTFNSNPICVSNYPAQMINQTPQLPDAVTSYTWVMCEGWPFNVPSTTITANNNAAFSPTFNFPTGSAVTLTFSVLLKAKSVEGCIDSTRNTIRVNDPQAFFYPTVSGACFPPAPKVNFIISTSTTYTNYFINFGDSLSFNTPTLNSPNWGHKYTAAGNYTPVITVTDNGGCVKSYTSPVFVVQNYPTANFVLADAITGEVKNKFCMPAVVQFTSTSTISPSNTPIALNWNGLGNSQPIVPSSVVATQYTNNAVYTISLSVSTIPSQCTSTKVYTIAVFRPTAGMTISQSTICLGQPLEMKILDRNGVEWWVWDYGVNSAQSNTILSVLQPTNPSHFYTYTSFPANPSGTVTLRMFYIDPAGACPAYKDTVIKLLKIDADFKRNNELAKADTIHCLGIPDKFTFNSASNSPSTLTYNWTYANAQSSNSSVLNYTSPAAGIYTVAINVSDPQFGCTATKVKKIIINPLPSAYLSVQDTSCPQVPFVLNGGGTPGVSGGLTATLNPGGITNFSMSTQNSFSLNTSALVSTTYSLLVTDDNGCVSPAATDYIFVQQAAPQINWDTTVVVGQTVQLNANVGSNYTYTWTPVIDNLNCVNCFNPITTTTVDITYSVTLEDHPLSCFKSVNTYKVKINLITTVDVPTAFTPNDDGTNDFIFPDGWGIKKLNYFKVFNRWGQLLFETNELKHGWDGKFNGVPQNMETYVYQVSAESYTKETYTKSGTFKLIR